MREIVIISGKGGAGKTSITGAFAHLSDNTILCDLDVDAPDLHMLLAPDQIKEEDFRSGNEAIIDPVICTQCGVCEDMCRFGAVSDIGGEYRVSPLHCEGCKVCVEFCPANAIDFPERHCGQWFVSNTRFGTMIHANLFPGEENSGRLVTLLKKEARTRGEAAGNDLILCDGAPGIGCPVISSLAGTDLAVVVTEPTPSGLHDLKRVAELCDGFRTKVAVIVNKWDVNPDLVKAIEKYSRGKGYEVICRLPHDQLVTDAMLKGMVVTEHDNGLFTQTLKKAWSDIVGLLD